MIHQEPLDDSSIRSKQARQAKEALAKVSKKTTGVSVKELLPRSRG